MDSILRTRAVEDAQNRASIVKVLSSARTSSICLPTIRPHSFYWALFLSPENRCHDAIAAFNQALKINPSNNAAKLNFKVARRKLELSNDTASTIEERIDRPVLSDSTPSENIFKRYVLTNRECILDCSVTCSDQ